ncbi:COG1361 family protein [Plantactinospora soyae]|uniref:Uncharacterized protein n=1 Tax=Plantactinospora soyae TaxID=1544732 RepID=A0A927M9Q8_9ACTN|nr:hypothetical protein [Plantactinospora soyae]MBE1490773.1 hypothetical protein [Plantactinospora soyae]
MTYDCFLSGIAPKSSQTFQIKFRALTKTRPYAMQVDGGRVAIADGVGAPYSRWGNFSTLFRSTTGSLHNPRTYKQDTVAKASITLADDEVTLVRQSNSRFEGRVRATVRYDGDAANNRLSVDASAPGVRFVGTDPVTVACHDSCDVPGGSFMQGEERTFDLLFEAPADAEPGVVRASGHLETRWEGTGVVPEKTPANNNLSFDIDISGPAMPPAGFTTLGIAATDLVYGPVGGSGSRTGSTTVTITNTGDATAASPMITFPVDGQNQDWSATWPCPMVLRRPDKILCISEPLLPGANRAITFMFSTESAVPSGPVTVRSTLPRTRRGGSCPAAAPRPRTRSGSVPERTWQIDPPGGSPAAGHSPARTC